MQDLTDSVLNSTLQKITNTNAPKTTQQNKEGMLSNSLILYSPQWHDKNTIK